MSVQWQQRDGWRQYSREWWDDLHKDLAELELRGALSGIRAVIAERLRQVQEGDLLHLSRHELSRGSPAVTAALLAAEIDRQAGEE